ncbi:hypothetical protein [Chitinophaga eiseniae]|uniref:Uncharacterized protein n=1 Tax=Chitinophaga eiseniae TaxID=634771 RepID=A0A847SGZ6_9BACT|nr:hypothetical protein [Chitinophaga eiseniae]NLR78305.1 hypothetical protein [Chitinophaga eiseniae]
MKFITTTGLLLLFSLNSIAQESLQTVTQRGDSTTVRARLQKGALITNSNLVVDGGTMNYNDPLVVKGNLDGAAIIRSNGADRWDVSRDVYEVDNYAGTSSSLLFNYGNSGIPYFRRDGHDFTIMKIWSPRANKNAYEATLALVNGDNEEEIMDIYNMSYPQNHSFGIRLQKRYSAQYKPFFFEYSDGTVTYPVMKLAPDSSAAFYGNVGIGTTDTKGYKLAVAGAIVSESVKVKQKNNWPDFVFKPAYQLASLQEVESYVKKYKHLPDMPAAKEVENNGLDLGEMNRKLLQKVEELTLYLIEQNKTIQEQDKRIRELATEVKRK